MLSFRESILIFGATILACASAGLLIVRLSNRLLKGLGWLGASFASGGSAAMLFLFDKLPPLICTGVADEMVLFAFVLLHVAILELVEADSLFPLLGTALLGTQASITLLSFSGDVSSTVRMATMGFMIAAQVAQTAIRLFREEKSSMIRTPATFCACLLSAFALLNIVRATAISLGLPHYEYLFYRLELATLAIYFSTALGIAFSFFWMTTTMLSTGLERIATTDPLTRLYNRRVFMMWCDKEMDTSLRTGNPFSLLMIDIDHFKKINDSYGHEAGDRALCTAVERMQDSIRGIDVLARWGGEEFAAVLPNATPEQAMIVAERVRANVERILLPARRVGEELDDPMIRLTVSVGVATYNGPQDSVEEMLRRADVSMYQAKAAGRNRVQATTDAADMALAHA
jgi:diguanylate cyclase (GGDEF)-like protein